MMHTNYLGVGEVTRQTNGAYQMVINTGKDGDTEDGGRLAMLVR